MTQDSPIPTVTLTVSTACRQAVLSRVTSFLLHGQYAFLQTFADAQQTICEINVPPPTSGIRLVVQATAATGPPRLVMPTLDGALPAELTALLQHLQAVCTRSEVC